VLETETRRRCLKFCSRRDRDETETIKIKSRGRLEAETSRPRLHPCYSLIRLTAKNTSCDENFVGFISREQKALQFKIKGCNCFTALGMAKATSNEKNFPILHNK